jgi:hypothetical protein
MNYLKIILVGSCLALCRPGATAAAKDWRGITPLRSTRADVERLLGVGPREALVKYDIRGGRVYVAYEMFGCDYTTPEGWPEPPRGWDVPKDTVVYVSVELEEPVPLDSIGTDLSDFKREEGDSHRIKYNNYKDGFTIEAVKRTGEGVERVVSYVYGPTAEDERFRCPARKPSKKTSP